MRMRLAKGNNLSQRLEEVVLFDFAVAVCECRELCLSHDLLDFPSDETRAAPSEQVETEPTLWKGLARAS